MRHGYHMALGFYSPYIMAITLLVISLIIYLALKNNTQPSIYSIKILDILKEKYAEGFITYDDYIKRKAVIEEYEYLTPYSLILLERYAKCELDITELFKLKKIAETESIDTSTRENLAKGVISHSAPVTSSTNLNPEEIKGYMTIEDVATALKMDIGELYEKLDIPTTVPKETKLKDVKNFVPNFEVETARESLKQKIF